MNDPINNDVKSDFITFRALVNNRKFTKERLIYLNDKKPNRKDTNFYNQALDYTPHKIHLIIEARQDVSTCFRFKLRCEEFTKAPYFRFDSDGATHRNVGNSNTLLEQIVTTPHFNSFDDQGISIAYKTDALKDSRTRNVLLNDINLCFSHFCHETNIRYPEEDFSEVVPYANDVLPLDVKYEDPLTNIKFDEQ